MLGSKRIAELITDKNALKAGRINIIEAPVSSGKTYFALNTIPAWASSASKILYLIDTTNGEMRIQKNIRTVGRQTYSFYHYGKKSTWGERSEEAENNMPVMTYAGFGTEVRNGGTAFHWHDFEYIICDEMQNLVNYQQYEGSTINVEAAEDALRTLAAEGKTKIVALSATPQKIRERFGSLCYDVLFDRTDVQRLETFAEIPYSGSVEDILLRHKGQTGILFTITIESKKNVIYKKVDDHHFNMTATIDISNQFFAWLLRFGTSVRLLSPASVVDDFNNYLEKIRKMYTKPASK